MYQEVQKLLAVRFLQKVIFKHETMIIQPNLFVKLRSVKCFNLVKRNHTSALLLFLTQDNIMFELSLIQQDICIGTWPHSSPFVTLEVSTKTLILHTRMWKNGNFRIVKFHPVILFSCNRPIMTNLWTTRMYNYSLEF